MAKQRTNVYLDPEDTALLKKVAKHELVPAAVLIREGIERVIEDRLNNPRRDKALLRAELRAFLDRHAGKGPELSVEEVDAIVRAKRRRRAKVGV